MIMTERDIPNTVDDFEDGERFGISTRKLS